MIHIKEVAKLANTSITTVSRVINNNGYVKKETKNRVIKAIEELGYMPLERADRNKVTKAIGLIVPNIENPFFGKVAKHISKIANDNNYNILLFDIQSSDGRSDDFLLDLIEKRVDGLIYASSKRCQEVINMSKAKSIPIVILDREVSNMNISTVVIDNNYGAFLATEHLIKLGHRKIAFIGGPADMEISIKRKEGYVNALSRYGIKYDNTIVDYGDYKMQSGYDAMKRLYSSGRKITGVVIANDLMAIGAMNYLNRNGVKIPDEVAIVGFDNIEISESIMPSLSTVEYPIELMSERVIDLILRQIKDKNTNIEMVNLYPKLLPRESSKCNRNK